MHQIRKQRFHLLSGKTAQQPVRHWRKRCHLRAGDFRFWQRQSLRLRLQRERLIRTAHDEPIEYLTVLRFDDRHAIVFANFGTGIQDVVQQIIQAIAVGSGQIGTNVLAYSVESVAL